MKNLQISPFVFQKALKEKTKENEGMILGSLIDALLTQPEEIDKKYIISKAIKPTGQLALFIDLLLENVKSVNITDNNFEEAYNSVGFKRKSLEEIIESFNQDGLQYYQEHKDASNGLKKLISEDLYGRAVKTYESLLYHPYTKEYFEQKEHIELIKQLSILWKYKGIQFKAILDLVKIDYSNKIIHLCDIKTTSSPIYAFKESVKQYQYWLQLGMYSCALYDWIITNRQDLVGYDVQMKWIVESTTWPGTPRVFKFNELELAMNGGKVNGKKYKGFIQLVDDFKWYNENGWNIERELVENNGEIVLRIEDEI